MPMTRELKKRLMGIEDRLEKAEKKKGIKTNGEPDVLCDFNARERLTIIEKVLMMPGPKRKEGQVLSEWAEIVDQLFTQLKKRTEKIEMVLQIPGETRGDTEILSAWREIVEKQIRELQVWTPLEAKTLDARVKNLWDRPSADSFKVFLKAIDERLIKLEQTPDPASDTNPTVFGKPLVDWIAEAENRIGDLERKPVAGPLSNIAQKMESDIQDLTKSLKTLRFKVRRMDWLSLVLFALILLTIYLT